MQASKTVNPFYDYRVKFMGKDINFNDTVAQEEEDYYETS